MWHAQVWATDAGCRKAKSYAAGNCNQPTSYKSSITKRLHAFEGSTFVGSEAPIAFVGVDGANVRWNTFYRPRKWVARILQETREPGFVPSRRGVFADNLVAYRSDEVTTAVNVGPETEPNVLGS